MWNDDAQAVDLTGVADLVDLAPSQFATTVGIGQYPVTVLDQAGAMATYAADGLRAQTHFVTQVIDGEDQVYGESLPRTTRPASCAPRRRPT